MSRDHDDRAKLERLAEAFMQDILATSDDEILAEVDQERIARVRTMLIEAKASLAKRALPKAKAEHEAWSVSRSTRVVAIDRSNSRAEFEQLRRGDPDFNRKMLMAARKGKAPTDTDVEGLIDDWADLKRLDGEGDPE
jgi:hypothetical protein